MMKIWVTGAKGQLGTELFLQHKMLPAYRFLFTDIEKLDLTQEKKTEEFIRKEGPGIIINCAAYTAVDKAEEEPDIAFRLNRGIPAILTRLAGINKSVVIHISTDYVFDGNSSRPYTETDTPKPLSEYAQSKYAGELEIVKNPGNIVVRTSWLYSPHGSNFVKTMLRLGKEREEIGVVDDQTGTPTSAADLADAILHIIKTISIKEENYGGIYHYSNEGQCTWYEFAMEIMKLAGLACKVKPIKTEDYPLPARRPVYSVMDKSKIKKAFGLAIPSWQESLKNHFFK